MGGELIKTQALTFVFVSGCSSPPPPSHASGRQGFGGGGGRGQARAGPQGGAGVEHRQGHGPGARAHKRLIRTCSYWAPPIFFSGCLSPGTPTESASMDQEPS